MPDEDIDPNGDGSFGTFDEETDDEDEFIYDDELEGSSDFDKDDYEIDENMYEDSASKRYKQSPESKEIIF